MFKSLNPMAVISQPSKSGLSSCVAEPFTPWIPSELVYLILEHLWQVPHTSQCRAALLKNIVLVNRTWLGLSARFASRDVYPACHHDPNAFIRLISQTSSPKGPLNLFSTEIHRVASQYCHSLTFDADGIIHRPFTGNDGTVGVGLALRLASIPNRLPNLRHISISHTDWAHTHIFQHLRLQGFPPQTTHLSLDYVFTAASQDHLRPFDVNCSLTLLYRPNLGPRNAFVPGLRHLALSGVPTPFPGLLLRHVCPHVETLELARPAEGQLPALAPLPPAVRTLVLRYPGVALSKEDMAVWALPAALASELFPPTGAYSDMTAWRRPPRIVMRLGTPDPVPFIELWRECGRCDVELVYERDDSRCPAAVPGARPEAESAHKDISPGALEIVVGWM
ncbi:hypothetical protein V8D89_006652 [Ganoderma adspersum]